MIDFETTPIGCPDCRDSKGFPTGLKTNNFTGNLDNCRTCNGDAEIFVCDSFATQKVNPLMSTKCTQCHATKQQHELIARYVSLVRVD